MVIRQSLETCPHRNVERRPMPQDLSPQSVSAQAPVNESAAPEQPHKFEGGATSLEETAEILKLEGGEAAPQVWRRAPQV